MKLISIFIFLCIVACTGINLDNKDIDTFITKYDNYPFGIPHGTGILLRSRGLLENTYIVDNFDGASPVYFVSYNLMAKSISKIDSSMFNTMNRPQYFSPQEIARLVDTLRHHDFFLLASDTSGNIFINPFIANEPPYFLKTKDLIQNDKVKSGYIYERYRGRWYLNNMIKRH